MNPLYCLDNCINGGESPCAADSSTAVNYNWRRSRSPINLYFLSMFLDVLYDFVEIFVVRLVGYGIVIFPPGRLNVKNLPLGDLRAVYAPKLECFLADTGRRLALRYESQLEAILLKHFRLADLIYYPVLRGFLLR